MAKNGRLYEPDTRNERRRHKWLARVVAIGGAYTYPPSATSQMGSSVKTIEDLRRTCRKLQTGARRSPKHFS